MADVAISRVPKTAVAPAQAAAAQPVEAKPVEAEVADKGYISEDGVSYIDNAPLKAPPTTPLKHKLAVGACAAAATLSLVNIGMQIAGMPTLGAAAGAVALSAGAAVAGWAAADLGSGIFHWTVDNYPTFRTPVIGKIAGEFQIHHHRTQDLHDFTLASNCANAGRFLWVPALALGVLNPNFALQAGALSLLAATFIAQGSHRWTHADKDHPNPKIAGWLQKLHVVQSPENHREHHRIPWSTHYCIVNGMNNGWMSKMSFFPRLEYLVYKVTGKRPHSWNDPGVEAYSRASFGTKEEKEAARNALLQHKDENQKLFVAKVRAEYEEMKPFLVEQPKAEASK